MDRIAGLSMIELEECRMPSRQRSRRTLLRLRSGSLLVAAGVFLALAPGAAAAPPEEDDPQSLPIHIPRTDTVEVRLVQVPVTVLDGRRRPVLDLGRDDFELLVDGRPWTITTFDAPEVTDTAAGSGPDDATDDDAATAEPSGVPSRRWSGARLRNTVGLVIDLYQTRLSGLASAFIAARELLSADLPPDSQVGLFAVAHGTMRTMVPFTTDRAALLATLDDMESNLALRDTWLIDEPARQREIASYVIPAGFASGTVEISPAAGAAVRGYSEEQARRSRRVLTALQSLAVAMARRTGRKNVVFVGDGLREQAGLNYVGGILLLESQPTGLAMGQLTAKTVSLRDEFRETMRVFRESGVTLSPVSTVGLFTETRLDPDALNEMLGSMTVLARETGGRRPAALNDFGREVQDAVYQTVRGYLLGFRPPLPDVPGTAHDIEVRVRRRGRFAVSHRTEYIHRPDRELERVQLLAGATLLPDEYSDLPLQVEVRHLPALDKQGDLQLQLSVPVRDLAWRAEREGRRVTEVEVSAVLRGSNGRTEMLFDTGYHLDVDATAPPERVVVQEARTVAVPPDPDIVIVLQDRTSDRVGTAVAPVPDLAHRGGGVRISRPGFLAPVSGVYLLTPTGAPLLGLDTGSGLLLPSSPARAGLTPVIAFAQVSGLPDGGRVQFCIESDRLACVDGGLRPYRPPADTGDGAGPDSGRTAADRTRTAWIALDPALAARRDDLDVRVVDAEGLVVAGAAGIDR